jgi:hypothetical protein
MEAKELGHSSAQDASIWTPSEYGSGTLIIGLALENGLILGKKNENKEELLVSKRNSNGLLADLLGMASSHRG